MNRFSYELIIFFLVVLLGLAVLFTPQSIPTDTNLIPNPSVESQNERSLPSQWQNNTWGGSTSQLSYVPGGYRSQNALLVSVTDYQDGDAKWFFTPQTIQPDTYYTYTDFYKSTAESVIVAEFKHISGEVTYRELGIFPSQSDWHLAATTFVTPPDASELTIFHLLRSNGELYTDNFSLEKVE